MAQGSPIPLFSGERLLGSWLAYYLPPAAPDEAGPWQPGALSALRNALATGHPRAIYGGLYLTDWRLVFAASLHWTHAFAGHFSLFLSRIMPPSALERSSVGVLSELWVSPRRQASEGPGHAFAVEAPGALVREVSGQLAALPARPPALREAFEEAVARAWWRAGLGLLTPQGWASLPGLYASVRGDDYRSPSADAPPSFEALARSLRGVEAVGVEQLKWLFAAPADAPPSSGPPGSVRLLGRSAMHRALRKLGGRSTD